MGFFDEIFGTQRKEEGFEAIPLSESQQTADKFLKDLITRIETFKPREIAGLATAEQGAVDLVNKIISGGIPGLNDAIKVLTQRMTDPIEAIPGLEGVFTKARELGSQLLGKTKRGLLLGGNLPTESSAGEKIYGRTLQQIMEGLVTAAYPFYAQGAAAKYAAPGQVADLATRAVTVPTALATTTGALPRQISQSVLDAIFEAARMTKMFPYNTQAGVAGQVMGQQRYMYDPGVLSPSIFSQIASAIPGSSSGVQPQQPPPPVNTGSPGSDIYGAQNYASNYWLTR